ncbi:hypothetical protein SAMN02745130_00963 [Thiothrix eikelboomii]|uniref:PIN domain-containing protein n=1 Tax=Thiothrix eikelboomii TaxID=92487 RepID=A0A1T4W3V2_9GAMM|nr:hypothetical protein SAMN02745130_00963 [Thiothrix eikelboomii]
MPLYADELPASPAQGCQPQGGSTAALVRCELLQLGQPIGHYDTLIAAHARSLQATLVTHNVREFERVQGLLLEDWEL